MDPLPGPSAAAVCTLILCAGYNGIPGIQQVGSPLPGVMAAPTLYVAACTVGRAAYSSFARAAGYVLNRRFRPPRQ